MTKQKSLLAALVLGALGACQAPSSDPDSPDSPDRDVLAITNARIFTAASDKAAFSPALGTLLVQDGKILDVGNIPVPSGTRVVDAGGQSLIPGLVVSHSHMGFKQLKSDALRGLTLNAASLFHLDNRRTWRFSKWLIMARTRRLIRSSSRSMSFSSSSIEGAFRIWVEALSLQQGPPKLLG